MTLTVDNYYSTILTGQLERALNLAGIASKAWYDDVPRMLRYANAPDADPTRSRVTLSQFYRVTEQCLVCGERSVQRLCGSCLEQPDTCTVRAIYAYRFVCVCVFVEKSSSDIRPI